MELSKTQKELLGKINDRLQRGDVTEIAKVSNFSREYVSKCLNQRADYFNQKIVDTAVNIISERDRQATTHLKTLTAA